jgi:antitoxin (DNA-binding transcriptional repressor) of toxin-antitoxin stability system
MSNKIAISKFKTHCLEIIEDLYKKHESIIITKRDKPIALVSPFKKPKTSLFGILKDKAEISSDIIKPIDEKWNVAD